MVQQRIKFIRSGQDGGSYYSTAVVEDDTNTISGGNPIPLDSGEDFRLIVRDDLPIADIVHRLQDLKTRLDQQLITDAADK